MTLRISILSIALFCCSRVLLYPSSVHSLIHGKQECTFIDALCAQSLCQQITLRNSPIGQRFVEVPCQPYPQILNTLVWMYHLWWSNLTKIRLQLNITSLESVRMVRCYDSVPRFVCSQDWKRLSMKMATLNRYRIDCSRVLQMALSTLCFLFYSESIMKNNSRVTWLTVETWNWMWSCVCNVQLQILQEPWFCKKPMKHWNFDFYCRACAVLGGTIRNESLLSPQRLNWETNPILARQRFRIGLTAFQEKRYRQIFMKSTSETITIICRGVFWSRHLHMKQRKLS
jgi:hypothetical protein